MTSGPSGSVRRLRRLSRPGAAAAVAGGGPGCTNCRPCQSFQRASVAHLEEPIRTYLLPRSPTDEPAPPAQHRRRAYPDHDGDELHIRSRCHDYHGNARKCHRRRRSKRKPAAACGTHVSRMHGIRNMLLAGRLTPPLRLGRQRLPCAESHVRASGRALTIRICRIWRELSEHTASLMLDWRDLLAP